MSILHIDYEELIKKVKTVHPHQDAAYFFDFIRKTIDGNTAQTLEAIQILTELDTEINEIIEDFIGTKPIRKSSCYTETVLNAVREARYKQMQVTYSKQTQVYSTK